MELTAQLQPPPNHPVQSSRLTYTSNPTYSFFTSANVFDPFVVGYFKLCVNYGGVNDCPTGGIAGMGRRMDDLYPVSPFGVLYTGLPLERRWPRPLDDAGRSLMLSKLGRLYLKYFQPRGVHKLVAWLPSDARNVITTNSGVKPGGQADRINGNSAWVLDIESDSLTSPRRLAHEVGHTLGLHHTGTNDGATDPVAARFCKSSQDGNLPPGSAEGDWQTNGPYTNGTIQQPGFNASGFPPAFYQENIYYDLMNYCAATLTWISPYHYQQLFNSISNLVATNPGGVLLGFDRTPIHPKAANAAPVTADYLLVSGSVSSDGSSGQLDPSEHIASTTPGDVPDPNGTYCLRQTDSSSKTQDFCFRPDFFDIDGNPLSQSYFAYRIPHQAGAVAISLISSASNSGPALAAYSSAGPPAVTIQSPKPGGTLTGVPTLTWTATDPASSPLTFIVDYSTDGGNTWLPLSDTVASDPLTATQYAFDTTTLLNGSQVYFQVTATNGLDSSVASVGPYTIANNPIVAADSTTLDFGNVTIGSSTDLQVNISNSGTGLLEVSSVTSDTAAFRVQSGRMFLEGGESETLVVTFVPVSTGIATGNIQINGGSSAGGVTIKVTGAAFDHTVPNLTVAPAVLAFGSVQTGQTEDLTLTLGNSGNADLTVTQLSFSDARFLAVSPAVPLTVLAGTTTTVTLRFQPNTTGAASNALTIVSNDPSHGSVQVAVTGLGTAAGGSGTGPQITAGGVVNAADYTAKVSRGALAFAFGTNLASPPTAVAQFIPLPYSMSGASVTVGGISAPIYVADPSFIEFQVPYEVAEGASIPVVVTYNGVQSNTVAVTVADYALGIFEYNRTPTILDPDIFHLNGTLVTPTAPAVPNETVIAIANGIGKLNNPPMTDAAVSVPYPTAVDVPVVTVGGVAAVSQYAGLLAGDLGVVQMNIQLPAQLPSGTLPLVVQFPGDSSPPVGLYVLGNVAAGAPQISVAQNPLTFSGGLVGQSQTLPLTITNTGSAPLTISNISLNPSGSPFTINYPSLPITLQPGGSTSSLTDASVTVTFTPTSAGMASAVVTIASNDPNTSVKSVGLSGTATGANVSPSIAVTPSGLNFSSVAEGTSKQVSLTVSNAGSAALNVTALTARGVFSVVSPATPFTVAAGSSSTVTLQFNPAGAGGQSSTLNIASNDPKQPNLVVPIWGTGYNPANVLTSDSFNRANATECALGTTDLKFGGTSTYQYLPNWPGNSGPIGASIVSGALQNNGLDYGGVQLTSSSDVCGAARGSSLPQDLDVIVDVYVPGVVGGITDAGPYFRSRAAAPGDGIFGGTSSGYWVEVFSTGQVWVDQVSPFEPIAESPPLISFDPSIVHTLEARIQGTQLQVWLDGQLVTFFTSGGAFTTVPVSTAANAGTAGIIFGSEENRGNAGGQSVKNLIISSLTAPAPQISVSTTSLNLGSVTVGQSANVSLNISNTGTAALNVSAIASSSAAVTIVSPVVPFTVQPGATTPVTVKFAPTAAVAVNGPLTITSNDPAQGQITVFFSGIGVPAAGTTINSTLTITGSGTSSGGNITATGTVTLSGVGTGTFSSSFSVTSVALTGSAPITITITSGSPAGTLTGVLSGSITLLLEIFAGTPTVSGPATITISSGTGGFAGATGSFSVTASGTGAGAAGSGGGNFSITGPGTLTIPGSSGGGTPAISAPTTTLQLGNVTAGQAANVPFNISNTGTAALTVSAMMSSSASVTVASPAIPFTLQPGATAPVTLLFAPTAAVAVKGSLTITSNDPAHGQITVFFSGMGVAAAGTPAIGLSCTGDPQCFLGASGASLGFGNVAVGQLSTMTFNVLNTGTAALTVSSVAISNPAFGLMTPAIPFTAQPGSTTPVTVVFAPQSAQAQSATFTVTSNDPAHPVVAVTLTGMGTGTSNNLLAYSNVVVGQSETGTLTFSNNGTMPLTVTAQTTTNAAFTVTSPSAPYNIAAGQSATIVIVFKPTTYTVYNATLSIVTSGGTFPTPLSGAGVVVQ